MALDDSPANGKAKSSAWIFIFMKPFEEPEDPLGVPSVESYAVVSDTDGPEVAVTRGCDVHLWASAVCLVFNRIR